MRLNRFRLGKIKKKVLLLLLGGVALSLAASRPGGQMRVLKELTEDWQRINGRTLEQAIASLYKSRLIKRKKNKDGTVSLILSDEGREYALTYDLEKMVIKKPRRWNGKWHLVSFDIPEKLRKKRDILRYRLRALGLVEFQKSVFVYPYPCRDELEYIVETYNLREYVRFVMADNIDNSLHLEKIFKLI